MIVLDTISGIWKSVKLKQKITSNKLSSVVSKMVLYQVALITTYLLDIYIFGEFFGMFISIPHFMTKMIAMFFCTIEVISLNENIEAVYGVNFFMMFKKILRRTKEIKEEIDEIKNPTE
jgi:hypothetical protein